MFNGYIKSLFEARNAFNTKLDHPDYIKKRKLMFENQKSKLIPELINEFGPSWWSSFLKNFIQSKNEKLMRNLKVYDIATVRLGDKWGKHGIEHEIVNKQVINWIKSGEWNNILKWMQYSTKPYTGPKDYPFGEINVEVAGYPKIPDSIKSADEDTMELRVYPLYMRFNVMQHSFNLKNNNNHRVYQGDCLKNIQTLPPYVYKCDNLLAYPLIIGPVC